MFSSQRILRAMFLGLVLLIGTNAHADWGWTGDTYKLVRPCNIDTGFVSYRDSQEPKGRYCTEGSCFAYHTNFSSGGKTYDYYGCEIVEQEPDPTPPPFTCPTGNSGTTVSSKKLRSVCMAYDGGHCAAQVTNSSLDSGLYDLSYTFTGVVCDPSAPADIDPTPDPQPTPDPTPDPEPDPDPQPDPGVACQPPRFEQNGVCVYPYYPQTREGFDVSVYQGDPSAVFRINTAYNEYDLTDIDTLVNARVKGVMLPSRLIDPDGGGLISGTSLVPSPKHDKQYPALNFSRDYKVPEILELSARILRYFNAADNYEYESVGGVYKCSQDGGRIAYSSADHVVNGTIKYKCNVYRSGKNYTLSISHDVLRIDTTPNGNDHGESDGADDGDGQGESGPCDPTKQVCPIDIRNQTNKLVEGLEVQTSALQSAIQSVETGISGVSDDINSLDGSIQSLGIKLDNIASNTAPDEAGPCDPTKQVCSVDIHQQTNKLVEGLEAHTSSLQSSLQSVGTGITGVSDDINSLDGSIQSLGIKLDTIANNTNPGEAQSLDDLLESPSGVFSDVTAFGNARTQEQTDLDSQYSQLSDEYTDSATSIEDKADTLFTSIKNRVINTYPEADCEGLAYAFDTNHEPLRITCEDTSFFRVGMLFFLSGYLLLDAYHLFRSKKDTV